MVKSAFCHRFPPVAEVPLSVKEGSTSQRCEGETTTAADARPSLLDVCRTCYSRARLPLLTKRCKRTNSTVQSEWPSLVPRRMPSRLCKALSSAPSFRAAQTNTAPTIARSRSSWSSSPSSPRVAAARPLPSRRSTSRSGSIIARQLRHPSVGAGRRRARRRDLVLVGRLRRAQRMSLEEDRRDAERERDQGADDPRHEQMDTCIRSQGVRFLRSMRRKMVRRR
jgi:hypothetical protein